MIPGIAIAGLLAFATPNHTQTNTIHLVQYDYDCGPHCQHRRYERWKEHMHWEHERWRERRHWEHEHEHDRYPPPGYYPPR